ncbi:MAG: hypothetical protein HY812_11165 [Planctomycetes bacterium]|nr:hypothetical protein [Planctomycetota bacterium]
MKASALASFSTLCFVLLAAPSAAGNDEHLSLQGPGASPAVAQPSLALGFIRNDGQ